MSVPALFTDRRISLCYWSTEARVVDNESLALEQHLARLGDVKVRAVKALDDAAVARCDLVIIAAQKVPVDDFAVWLGGIRQRIHKTTSIWTPALILADIPFASLSDLLLEAVRDNWYFDILAPAHISSLPMRVANLVRIHDHLQELKRYSAALEDVSTKVKHLEGQVQQWQGSQTP